MRTLLAFRFIFFSFFSFISASLSPFLAEFLDWLLIVKREKSPYCAPLSFAFAVILIEN